MARDRNRGIASPEWPVHSRVRGHDTRDAQNSILVCSVPHCHVPVVDQSGELHNAVRLQGFPELVQPEPPSVGLDGWRKAAQTSGFGGIASFADESVDGAVEDVSGEGPEESEDVVLHGVGRNNSAEMEEVCSVVGSGSYVSLDRL